VSCRNSPPPSIASPPSPRRRAGGEALRRARQSHAVGHQSGERHRQRGDGGALYRSPSRSASTRAISWISPSRLRATARASRSRTPPRRPGARQRGCERALRADANARLRTVRGDLGILAAAPAASDPAGGDSASGDDYARTVAVRRIVLTDFRGYAAARVQTTAAPVVLTGPNGAGKTTCWKRCPSWRPDAGCAARGSARWTGGCGMRRARWGRRWRDPGRPCAARDAGGRCGDRHRPRLPRGQRARTLRIDGAPAAARARSRSTWRWSG